MNECIRNMFSERYNERNNDKVLNFTKFGDDKLDP